MKATHGPQRRTPVASAPATPPMLHHTLPTPSRLCPWHHPHHLTSPSKCHIMLDMPHIALMDPAHHHAKSPLHSLRAPRPLRSCAPPLPLQVPVNALRTWLTWSCELPALFRVNSGRGPLSASRCDRLRVSLRCPLRAWSLACRPANRPKPPPRHARSPLHSLRAPLLPPSPRERSPQRGAPLSPSSCCCCCCLETSPSSSHTSCCP
jgi:hypothetical protein